MATRKDLLKAQAFVRQRMVSALVLRDPDNQATPLKRLRTGTFIGVLVGVLIMAGFGVAGLLLNGGFASWKDSDSDLVIIDTESGGVFTYRGDAGNRQLRPAANITSALLLVDDGVNNIRRMKTDSMKGVEILPMQGIPKAPRQLPKKDALSGSPLRLCSAAPKNDYRAISLEVGSGDVPSENRAFLLQGDDQTEYFVYNGVKHLVDSGEYARSPLFIEFQPIQAGNRFLNSLPTGSTLKPLDIPGKGDPPVKDTGQRMVGDIVSIGERTDPNSSFFIVLPDGYSRISYIDAAMLPDSFRGKVDRDTIARATSSTASSSASDLPDGMPDPDPQSNSPDASVCATWTDSTKPPIIALGVDTPTSDGTKTGNATADVVTQVEGSGALLQNSTSLSSDAAVFLVVNRHKFPIPDLTSRAALGYSDATITKVPPQLLVLLPDGLDAGDTLNYDTASRVVDG